jgi:hypothetical protein
LIVVLENTDYENALAQPFLKDLAARGALLSNVFAVAHPSLPNYVALTTGSTYGLHSNDEVTLDVPHIGDLVEGAGRTWKVYAEGYPGNCFLGSNAGAYVRRHVPFLSFQNVQTDPARCQRIVNASVLASDIENGTLPDYGFYVPDVNNDGHDTGVAFADQWLAQTFGPRLQDSRFTDGTLFVVTFDEGSGTGSNHIYTVLYGPGVVPGSVSTSRYDHYSLLRTIEDALGLGTLGQEDARASAISGVWQPTLEVRLNQHAFRPAERMQVDVTVANDGPQRLVDVYFGALLPVEVGPGLGCPAGDAIAFVTQGSAVVTCLTATPKTFAPLFRGVSLPFSLPETTIPNFRSVVWPSDLPTGAYTIFLTLTPPDAFADGRADPTDLLATASQGLTFAP